MIPGLVPDLRPGFRLLTDLSGLESMDLACVPYIEQMMDLCNKKGVEMVVRVIPDPHKDIGLNIMSLFHYPRRVRIVTCETLEEAMSALEK
jgi:predicted choloylglycine hydrolase